MSAWPHGMEPSPRPPAGVGLGAPGFNAQRRVPSPEPLGWRTVSMSWPDGYSTTFVGSIHTQTIAEAEAALWARYKASGRKPRHIAGGFEYDYFGAVCRVTWSVEKPAGAE